MKRSKAQLNAISRSYAAKALRELEAHTCAKLLHFSTYKTLRSFVKRYENDAAYAVKIDENVLLNTREWCNRFYACKGLKDMEITDEIVYTWRDYVVGRSFEYSQRSWWKKV